MHILGLIICSTLIVSMISLVGIFSVALKDNVLRKILLILVGFSAGALMGGALLHLLPEATEGMESGMVWLYVLIGFTVFFLLEKILKWHHCHKGHCDEHTFTHMSIVGDTVHNFIDGIIIAVSYLVSVPLGIISTVAIIAHEVPQELGDFGILVYGGYSKAKALFYNFLSALTAIVGALFGYFLSASIDSVILFLVPFAAGGFIYIAASDLVPELHKETNINKSMLSFAFFVIGIYFMWLIKFIFEH